MTRSRADAAGIVGESTVRYYVQRATAGLIITEATNVSADAVGSPRTPGIWSDAQVEAWKKVTSAVHAEGGTIVMQLWHTGRVGHSDVRGGRLPVAPSAVAILGQKHITPTGPKDYEVPHALTNDEVRATIDDFAHGAKNARTAGFDGVELHGAFGYLPHQFLVDSANQRTDEYGGTVENRARFVLEVMARLVGVWGEGRVGIRLSPTLAYNGMVDSDPLATFSYLIEQLNALPLAYLHLMRATPDAVRFPSWPRDTIATFGPLFRGALLVNGGFDRDSAEAVVEADHAQGVSFGAPFVSNPDLVHRFAAGAPLAAGDRSTFYGGGEKGYVDYPALRAPPPAGREGLLARDGERHRPGPVWAVHRRRGADHRVVRRSRASARRRRRGRRGRRAAAAVLHRVSELRCGARVLPLRRLPGRHRSARRGGALRHRRRRGHAARFSADALRATAVASTTRLRRSASRPPAQPKRASANVTA